MAHEVKFRNPCNDCPFRRNAISGWLGGGTPEHYLSAARADYYMDAEPGPNGINARGSGVVTGPNVAEPCHKTIDYSDPDWATTQLPNAAVCVGGLIFNRNDCKSPRHPVRADLCNQVEPSDRVFRTDQEFLDYHNGESS